MGLSHVPLLLLQELHFCLQVQDLVGHLALLPPMLLHQACLGLLHVLHTTTATEYWLSKINRYTNKHPFSVLKTQVGIKECLTPIV